MRYLLIFALLCGCAFSQTITGGSISISGVGGITFTGNGLCGPPLYLCSSTSTANAGTIASIFSSRIPSGTVNIQNTASGPCVPAGSQSCMIWQSGDQFDVTWQTGTLGNNITIGGVGGAQYRVATWNSATVATLASTGTFTNIPYYNQTACIGDCPNTVRYDLSMNPSGIDPYVRVTDGTSSCGGAGQSMNATGSGGDNDNQFSKNSTYLDVVTTGAANCILHLNTSGHAVQVVNTGVSQLAPGAGALSFSRTVDTRFFLLKNFTQIIQYDIVNDTLENSSTLVDVAATGVCPGLPNPFGATVTSIMTSSATDDTFIVSLSNAGGQNTPIWTVAWSRARGCSTVNMQTGQAWAFCTSSCTPSTPPLGTLNTTGGCWGAAPTSPGGIHDTLGSLDGSYAYMTVSGTWSQGACAGINGPGYSVWQVGTTVSQWCSNQQGSIAAGCVDHTSIGYSHAVSNYYNGPNIRSEANVAVATQFAPPYSPLLEDWHSGWPPTDFSDTNPIIIGTDDLSTANGSGCANAVNCPIYLHNEIFSLSPVAVYPPGGLIHRFGHTFSCGRLLAGKSNCAAGSDFYFQGPFSIMAVSQDGKYAALTSTSFGTLGNDAAGHPRQDIFVITLD